MVDRKAVNCEQVWQEISNYIEGEVDAPLRAAMDEHFRACRHCASVLAGTRNVIALYSDERMIDEQTIEVPAGFGRRLERRLAQNARVSGGTRWSTPTFRGRGSPAATPRSCRPRRRRAGMT